MLNGKQIKRKAFITKLCVKGATCSVSAQNFNCPFRGSKHQTIIWYHLIPTVPDTRFKVYTHIIPRTASSICQAHSFRPIKWIMQTKQVLRPIYSALLTCVQSPPAGADIWWPNINSCILTVLWTLFNAGLNPRSKQQAVLKSITNHGNSPGLLLFWGPGWVEVRGTSSIWRSCVRTREWKYKTNSIDNFSSPCMITLIFLD